MAKELTPQEMMRIDLSPPTLDWMDIPVDIKPGIYCYPAKPEKLEILVVPSYIKVNYMVLPRPKKQVHFKPKHQAMMAVRVPRAVAVKFLNRPRRIM
jgi:hypothetical protein